MLQRPWIDGRSGPVTGTGWRGGAGGVRSGSYCQRVTAARDDVALAVQEQIEQIDVATRRLLQTVRRLDDDVRQASSLPGWTRGHVLTHVARGGDAMRALLRSARTGVPEPAYVSQQARDGAIEQGAGRGAAELLADLATSAESFRDEVLALPEHGWQFRVQVLGGVAFPASELLVRRLVEVELHHTDLSAGYSSWDWPPRFVELELPEPACSQRADRLTSSVRR